jgi:hypothetical protein
MRFKVGDFVWAMDELFVYNQARRRWVQMSRDTPRPRLRIVCDHVKGGYLCATVEGGLPLFFKNTNLRLANRREVEMYKPVDWKTGSVYQDQARGRNSDSEQ